jgi:hypothetical protein
MVHHYPLAQLLSNLRASSATSWDCAALPVLRLRKVVEFLCWAGQFRLRTSIGTGASRQPMCQAALMS